MGVKIKKGNTRLDLNDHEIKRLYLEENKSTTEIAELLKSEYKIEIDKKKIDLKETIKTLGVRTVSIKLYEGITGSLKIDVISSK